MDIGIDNSGCIGHVLKTYLKLTAESDVSAKLKASGQMEADITAVVGVDKGGVRMKIVGFCLDHSRHELAKLIDSRIVDVLFLLAGETVGIIETGIYIPTQRAEQIEPEREIDRDISIEIAV